VADRYHADEGALLAAALGDADPAVTRHLAECLACRRAHQALLDGVDLALAAAPGAAPPPGFESRVLERLRGSRRPDRGPSRRSRWLPAAAAALLGVAAGVGGAQLLDRDEPAPAVSTSAVPLGTDGGTTVGTVSHARGEDGEQLVVTVGARAPGGWVTCRVVRSDGSAEELARWPVAGDGELAWTVDRPTDAVAVELVTDDGEVWARAEL